MERWTGCGFRSMAVLVGGWVCRAELAGQLAQFSHTYFPPQTCQVDVGHRHVHSIINLQATGDTTVLRRRTAAPLAFPRRTPQ